MGTQQVFKQEFRVLNNETCANIILGRDFLKKYGEITFDFENNRIKVDKRWLKGITIENKQKQKVTLSSAITLPPRSEKVVIVNCKASYGLLESEFHPKIKYCDGIYAVRAQVVPNINGEFKITLLNTTAKEIKLGRRCQVGILKHACESVVKVEVANKHFEEKTVLEKIKFGKQLNEAERARLVNTIKEYSDVFVVEPNLPQKTTLMEHKIETKNEIVYVKPRRIPFAWEDDVDHQISEMLANDVIRPSKSPWNSPILLVKKPNGENRFLCDYRNLNDITKKDTYPLPHIKDVIDKMQNSLFWTTLDAASAYWAVPVSEPDKEKTAFSVKRGKFEFNVMPYGLCNSGASYQRLMDMCLSGLRPDRILAYMDDLVIFTPSFEEHSVILKQVFDRLRISGIQLKPSKCLFASNIVNFLGYELSNKGIKPQDRLTEAIVNFRTPKSKKEMKRFLGTVSFYRCFIKNFATIAEPLNRLTSDKVPFKWDTHCETAFQRLKSLLIIKPVLAFPQPGKLFILEVDASDVAVGGVLSQYQNDNKLHPVAYFSNSLTESQKKWSTYNKETFAMVYATRHWYVYLVGSKFLLRTDHNPLTHIRKKKDPHGKLARWIAELECFNFDIEYIPGSKNTRADALSRNEGSLENTTPPDWLSEKLYSIDVRNDLFAEQLTSEQDNDIVISFAKEEIAGGRQISKGQLKRISKQLRIENNILTKSGRPVVPPNMRKFVITEYHKDGHFSSEKLLNIIKSRFYWPGMTKYLQNHVSSYLRSV